MENGQMTSKIGGLLKDPRSKGAWVKWAGLVVIAALIIFNIGAILGFVTNVVRLALLLAGVIAAWLVVSSKSFQQLVVVIFETVVRGLTVWFTERNPLTLARYYQSQALDAKNAFADQKGKLEGFIEKIRGWNSDSKKQARQKLATVEAANNQLKAEKKKPEGKQDKKLIRDLDDNITLWSGEIANLEDEGTNAQEMLKTATEVQDVVEEMYKNAEFAIRSLDSEIRHLTKQFEMANVSAGLMHNIKKILRPNSQSVQIYDIARQTIQGKYAAAIGDLRNFSRDMKGMTLTLNLRNTGARNEVLKRLEVMRSHEVLSLPEPSAAEKSAE
jgi:hypothetical protein